MSDLHLGMKDSSPKKILEFLDSIHTDLLICSIAHRLGRAPAAYCYWRSDAIGAATMERTSFPATSRIVTLLEPFLCLAIRTSGLACPLGVAAVGDVGYWTAQTGSLQVS
jgi:hypothetical protein